MAAILTGFVGIYAPPAMAEEPLVSAYDVAASVSALPSSAVPFVATGTITNTGLLAQGAGATLTFSVTGGTVTGGSCGGLTCTAGPLDSGLSESFTLNVTPNVGGTAVVTKVDVLPAPPLVEINVLPDSANNHAETTTTTPYGVDVSIVNDPSAVAAGEPTRLDVTATNLLAPQSMTMTLQSGGTLNPFFPLPGGCSTNNNGATVTCTTSATSITWPISIKGAQLPFTSTASVQGSVTGQDSASVQTTFNPDAYSFLGEGDCISRNNTFTGANLCANPGSTSGGAVVVEGIHQVDPSAKLCGTVNCANAAPEVIVRKTGNYVPGTDKDHPLSVVAHYEKNHQPPVVCAGSGSGANCFSDAIYYQFNINDTPKKLLKCTTPGKLATADDICWDTVTKLSGGSIDVKVLFLKDLILPIVGSSSK